MRPLMKTRETREGHTAAGALVARLTRRPQFLRVARKGISAPTPGLVLQACVSDLPEAGSSKARDQGARTSEGVVRVGFTASRKVGGAVVRNRCRRRLRALVREMFPEHAARGYDYVLIARAATVERPYPALGRDLKRALKRLDLWRDSSGSVAGAVSREVKAPTTREEVTSNPVPNSPERNNPDGGCNPSFTDKNSGAGRS